MSERFKPAWWLRYAHLQTLWPTLIRRSIQDLPIKRERIELPDGDFIDLDWMGPDHKPLILILHGLEGSIVSPYAKGMMQALVQNGFQSVFMHFRGCSGEPNRLPRAYHSGETSDLASIVACIKNREPHIPMGAVGFSLGGNVLLKWLGETRGNNPFIAAIAVSVPFELYKASDRINCGFSRIYQWHFLRCLKKKMHEKFSYQTFSPELLKTLHTLRDFDDQVTAPLHGFKNAEDYYVKCSSRPYLKHIEVPTLLLHAKDDPFMTEDVLPSTDELSQHIQLELSEKGGHVGFVEGALPWRAEYWLEKRVPAFLRGYFNGIF